MASRRLVDWWAEARHRPTDGRLDYCRCGESWPCSWRRKWVGDRNTRPAEADTASHDDNHGEQVNNTSQWQL